MRMAIPAVAISILCCGLAMAAGSDEGATDQAIEEVEATELPSGVVTNAGMNPLTIAGRLHPAAVHLPIGMLLCLLAIELLTGKRGEWQRCSNLVAVLALLAFVPAVVSGMLRAKELSAAGAAFAPIALHRGLMIASFLLTAAAVGWKYSVRRRQPIARSGRAVFLSLLLLAVASTVWGGHLGGKLVFGQNHLPF